MDQNLWSDLISALQEVREPWRHAREVDKELISYLLSVIAAIDHAKERAAQENATVLVADLASRQSDLYGLLADLLKQRSPQP